MVSYCFCLFGEFPKVFERKVWRVQVVLKHLSTLNTYLKTIEILYEFDVRFYVYTKVPVQLVKFADCAKHASVGPP